MLAAYTATLISNTAIPAWSEARIELPFTFVGSAAASAGAAATMLTPPRYAGPARRLAIGGAIVEAIATESIGRHLGPVGEPYRKGTAGRLLKAAKGLTVAGALTLGLWAGRDRGRILAGAGMLLAGSVLERWGVFRAGFQSA